MSDSAGPRTGPGDPVLGLVDRAEEVVLEVGSGTDRLEVVIWAVTTGGRIFVRSYLGEQGRWYRTARSEPDVTLRVGARRFSMRALPVEDPDTIDAVSGALREKYSDMGQWLEAMVAPNVLATTLRLEMRR